MKKIIRYAAAAAAAVLTLVACNKNETSAPEIRGTRISIGVKPEEAVENTKTFIEEEATPTGSVYHAKWSNSGESLGVIFGEITTSSSPIMLSSEETTDNNPTFTGEAELEDGDYAMFLFYPHSAYEKCYAAGTIGFNLKASQHPVLGSFDPSCDLMGWATDKVTVENSSLSLQNITLVRPMAILRVNLNADEGSKAKGLVITGFKMEVPKPEGATSDIILTGRAAINAQGEIASWNIKNNYVEASIDPAELITIGESDGFNALYLIVNPETIPAGASINFSIETEQYSGINKITRTVTVPEGGMRLEAGKVNTINLKVRDKDFPGTIIDENYEGDWLITGLKDENAYAAVAYDGSSNNLKQFAITIDASGSITSEEDLNESIMTFTKVTEGDYAGMYTIQDANGKYLYASSSSGNQLKAKASPDQNAYWAVNIDAATGNHSIVASQSSNRNVMQYNGTSGVFACYSSASQAPVKLYPASAVSGLVTDPVITFEGAEPMDESSSLMVTKTVSATATSVEFPYTKNKYVTELPTVRRYSYSGAWFVSDNGWEVTDSKVTVTLTPNTTQYARDNQLIVLGQGFTDEARMYLLIKQEAAQPASTIATVLEGGAGSYDSIENLLVYDVKGKSVIVGDDTGKMLLFMDNHNLSKGDIFSISNAVTTVYQNVVLEITGGTIDKKSSGNTVNHGTSIAIDDYTTYNAQKEAFSATGFHSAVYVAMIGDQSGKNIQGSNAKLYLSAANDATDGKRVETTGYIYAFNSSYSNFNYQAVTIEEFVDPDTPSISADVTELTWAADEYGPDVAKTINVTINANATGFNITCASGTYNTFMAIKNSDNTVTVYPKEANTSTTDIKYCLLSLDHKDDPDNVFARIALKQSKAGGTAGWELVTNFAYIISGDKYMFVKTYDNKDYCMPSSACSQGNMTNIELTSDPTSSGFTASNDMWFILTGDPEDGFVMSNSAGQTLQVGTSNNGLKVATGTGTTLTFQSGDSGLTGTILKGKDSANTLRYIGGYQATNFRCYTSVNSNIKACTYKWYHYKE